MDSFALGFSDIDNSDNPQSFKEYLDLIHSLPFFQEAKQQSFQKLGIRSGSSVLEIGCGNGIDASILAEMTGKTGKVIGIDVSRMMLESARDRINKHDCIPDFLLCDAQKLPFPDGSFDAVRVDRVLQHTKDPLAIIREMARTIRKSGKIVVFEPDWESLIIWPGKRDVTRKILNFECDRLSSGWVGRSLFAYFSSLGLNNVEIIPRCLVLTDLAVARKIFTLMEVLDSAVEERVVKADDVKIWDWELSQADAVGQFFSSLTFYLICGTKI